MKLATLNDGSRDGQLAVVSRDLKAAHIADGIAPTLQAALDDWAFIAPQLASLYDELNAGRTRRPFDFDPARCMAPLPRAYQWVDGPVQAQRAEEEPQMAQGGGDDFLGPMDDIVLAYEEWGIDFEAGIAAITGDIKMGATPDEANGQIRLLMLSNGVALRNLTGLQAKAAAGFSPVAVTPDELGDNWRGGKVHLPLRSTWNGRLAGQPDAGADMVFNFPRLIAHLCKTRKARAGSIVGAGYTSIAEQRAQEESDYGQPVSQFMRFGDTIRIEMLDEKGKSIFGAIEQKVARPG
jgi:fumarylacetoacetate (FAA) hydrolase